MARRLFFSFHYQKDVWRVSQVRNCNIVKSKYDKNDFLDAADWESIKKQGKDNVKKWINNQLNGTSVTVVLIGNETNEREFVNYEIQQSIAKGNGFLGIYIHNVQNQKGATDLKGQNPLEKHYVQTRTGISPLSSIYKTYDWEYDNGRQNIESWIEDAVNIAGR